MTDEKDQIDIRVDVSEIRKDLPPVDDNPACPKCKAKLYYGIGMAGGGFGMYAYCDNCKEVVQKTAMEE